MTIWPARLSKDGTKVLCGRTVDGRQNCTEVLAVIQYGAPWGASVLFHGFYEEARPQEPGEPIYGGPTYLRIGTYAAKKLAHGQTPKRYTVARPGSSAILILALCIAPSASLSDNRTGVR